MFANDHFVVIYYSVGFSVCEMYTCETVLLTLLSHLILDLCMCQGEVWCLVCGLYTCGVKTEAFAHCKVLRKMKTQHSFFVKSGVKSG